MGQARPEIGVKPPEKPLAKGVGEDLFHAFVAEVARPQSVAMPNQKLLPVNNFLNRLPIDGYSKLLFKIAKHPQIVVARKNIHGQSSVAQLRQSAK